MSVQHVYIHVHNFLRPFLEMRVMLHDLLSNIPQFTCMESDIPNRVLAYYRHTYIVVTVNPDRCLPTGCENV